MVDDYVLPNDPFPNRIKIGMRDNSDLIKRMKSISGIPCEVIIPTEEQVIGAISRSIKSENERFRRQLESPLAAEYSTGENPLQDNFALLDAYIAHGGKI